MEPSRGSITPHRLFSVKDLGLGNPEPHVDLVINEFLTIGDAVAARWIQMPKAILLLQMAPENPASGAIYVYDRLRQEFYLLSFEGAEDDLTVDEFSSTSSRIQPASIRRATGTTASPIPNCRNRVVSPVWQIRENLTEFRNRGTKILEGEVCDPDSWLQRRP